MQRHYLIIDGNSIGHQAQNMKPLTLGDMQVQAIFGFLRTLRAYVSKYSFATPVVLWDGVSWRSTAYPEYKENRKKAETKHEIAQQQSKKAYAKQRPYIQKALSFLGVTQVVASNMEADDLAAILSDLYTSQGAKCTLLTEDRDWLQLIGPNVAVEQPKAENKRRVSLENFTEITGCKNTAMFVEMKALMGDSGDNIKGIGGVGDKRAIEFLETYGSFSNFLEQVSIQKSIDFKKLPKWQRDLVEDESKAIAFDFNIRLVDLRTKLRPKPTDLFVNKGEPSADHFRQMCDLLLFKSITDNFGDWISAFPVAQRLAVAA